MLEIAGMEYHFAPDFLDLLIETIPRLSRTKRDVLLFFQGAGVPARYLDDLRSDLKRDKNSHSKFDLARLVLIRLNEGGDSTLAARREVVKRVVEFEDFTRCWPTDALEAEGLVAKVRRLRNVKDSFTRINLEREREKEQARSARQTEVEALRRHRQQIEEVKREFFALFGEQNPHRRGKALELVLNKLFSTYGVLIREAFVLRLDGAGAVEQIDGVIELDGHLYLVEMKWWNAPLGPGETAQHLVRVFARDSVRGLFISASGYTQAAIEQYRQALSQKVVTLCTLEELVKVLDNKSDFLEFLRHKIRAAQIEKEPFLVVA